MSLESILFARLVVGDDGGDLEQPQSYKKEVSKRKEKMYTQTGYFAGWVHHRPCWRHSRKPVLSFFFRVLQTFWFFKREEITANSYNIFGCLSFSEPPSLSFFHSFFLSFFLSPLQHTASASWRVIYNRWRGDQGNS